jgi:hypothetical protein
MNMKGYTVNFWRTVQLFLTENYIAEVEVHSDTKEVRCNCPNSSKLKQCSHIKFVKAEMKNSDGNYTIKIPQHVDEELVDMALQDAELFRQFIIDYGKVEVID